ncbi:MAG: secondary thiamine-phosphate synthase enzyme YjbQ [Nanoarchaeota archaeon]|nr:secondary thiamine-phosphate synthase enzyme YjbQ [Nanoarchaeota archaeon]
MKTYTEYITITAKKQKEIINITDQIEEAVEKSGIKEGICLVNSMHITSSVFINDEESGLKQDFMRWLEELAPEKPNYLHHHTGETNADAHLKRTVMGREVVIAITNSKLDFGPWEQVFYGEFDGKRPKKVLIKIIGE